MLKKIFTIVQHNTRSLGDKIVDANAIKILEQEIHNAQVEIDKAKSSLASMMSDAMSASRKVNHMKHKMSEYESYARDALAKNNEELAMEIAEKIVVLKTSLSEEEDLYNKLEKNIEVLKNRIKKTSRDIKEYSRQLSIVKTQERVQKATSAINRRNVRASNTSNIKSSLERIKKRQEEFDDLLEAGDVLEKEFSDSSFDEKLLKSGIKKNHHLDANSILANLKNS